MIQEVVQDIREEKEEYNDIYKIQENANKSYDDLLKSKNDRVFNPRRRREKNLPQDNRYKDAREHWEKIK